MVIPILGAYLACASIISGKKHSQDSLMIHQEERSHLYVAFSNMRIGHFSAHTTDRMQELCR